MDIHELKQFESVYQPSKEIAFCWLRKQYVQLSTEENHAEVVDHANDSLRIWQAAKAQAVPDGFVVVPVQCPDPDFADSLFDELSKKAIGEFGDDLLIHFSDIDEEKIWALMLEAAQEQAND